MFARGTVPAALKKRTGDVIIGAADEFVASAESELDETLQALPGKENLERKIKEAIAAV